MTPFITSYKYYLVIYKTNGLTLCVQRHARLVSLTFRPPERAFIPARFSISLVPVFVSCFAGFAAEIPLYCCGEYKRIELLRYVATHDSRTLFTHSESIRLLAGQNASSLLIPSPPFPTYYHSFIPLLITKINDPTYNLRF